MRRAFQTALRGIKFSLDHKVDRKKENKLMFIEIYYVSQGTLSYYGMKIKYRYRFKLDNRKKTSISTVCIRRMILKIQIDVYVTNNDTITKYPVSKSRINCFCLEGGKLI